MKKLFIVPDDHDPKYSGAGVYHLIAEDGEHLASHLCSSAGFARGDLEAGRPERQAEWKARFGEYEVIWLKDQSEISLEELVKRYEEYKGPTTDQDKSFGVTLEMDNSAVVEDKAKQFNGEHHEGK